MDKLKTAFALVASKAKEQRRTGAIPTVLGVTGMLALMYDRICKFTSMEDKDEQVDTVIDLAVKAMFAVAEFLPDILEDEIIDEDPLPQEESPIVDEDDDDINDPRFTKILPGQTLKDVHHD